MNRTMRDNLHDLISDLSGLEGSKVIWANFNAPKIAPPFIRLSAFGEQAESMAELRGSTKDGFETVVVPTSCTLSVDYFGSDDDVEVVDTLNEIVRALERPTIVDRCARMGVAVTSATAVSDTSQLTAGGAKWEIRANTDLRLSYMHAVEDETGAIESINIKGGVTSKNFTEGTASKNIKVEGAALEVVDGVLRGDIKISEE